MTSLPKGYVIPRLKLAINLLSSVTGKTEQLMLLQAVTAGSNWFSKNVDSFYRKYVISQTEGLTFLVMTGLPI